MGTELITATVPPYREGTQIAKTKVALVFNAGGIGDYIHWVGAVKYAIDSNPHIHGHILAPPYFYDLAELWLEGYSERFKVIPFDSLESNPYLMDRAAIVPDNRQLANACGFHLTELGFIYFTQKKKVIVEYAEIPRIEGDEVPISRFNLPKDYVVIPTEATAENRMLPVDTLNLLTGHLILRGYTPVFLGKRDLAPDYTAKSATGIRLKGVLDLREKTSLREAAVIMSGAKFVLGMDGGLLHLASCSAVPVIFIFTTVHPDFRIPQRRPGAETVIVTPPKELHCRFCNTGDPSGAAMSYVIGHDFKNCLYTDNLCTKLIDAKTLIPVIDRLLEVPHGT
jgi:hypothetical protein